MVKKYIRLFFLSVLAVSVTLALLELLFRTLLPAATHPFYKNYQEEDLSVGRYGWENDSTGIKTFGPLARHPARWKINNHGWNSDIHYQYGPVDSPLTRTVVIGDSYVEALNVNPRESFTAVLREHLRPDEVYSLGIGGSPFSQYLHFARFAAKAYQPDRYIILLTKNDFDESLIERGDFRNLLLQVDKDYHVTEVAPEYFEIPNPPWMKFVKHSALARYLYYNLQLTRLSRLIRIRPRQQEAEKESEPGEVQPRRVDVAGKKLSVMVRYLLSELKEVADGKPILILADGDREHIQAGKPLDPTFRATIDTVASATRDMGMGFIDLGPVFADDFNKHHRRMNTRVDYHWNAYGHQLVADTTYRYLMAKDTLAPDGGF